MNDSFAFTEKIVKEDSEFFIESPDVDSLFTNISFEEKTFALIYFLKMLKE